MATLNNSFTSAAVIAAAGSGTRMGGVSKPNIKLLGKTLFEYVLDALSASAVGSAVVVCSADNEASLRALSVGFDKPICFVRGGACRAESVFNGISATDADIVCVHDCARPFITPEMIDKTVEAAAKHGAACVSTPMTDTVKYKKQGEESVVTLNRDELFTVQTPQAFKKAVYLSAKEALGDSYKDYTDETSLLESNGFSVEYLTFGTPNMKITTKTDVLVAEAIMEAKK